MTGTDIAETSDPGRSDDFKPTRAKRERKQSETGVTSSAVLFNADVTGARWMEYLLFSSETSEAYLSSTRQKYLASKICERFVFSGVLLYTKSSNHRKFN